VFALAIGAFVAYFINDTYTSEMLKVDEINNSQPTREVLEASQETANRLDYIVFSVFLGMVLALMVTSWFVAGNPVFMFVYFIMMIIGVALSAINSNIWSDVSTASVFGSQVAAFPLTNHILSYFPIYMAAVGLIGLVVMFAKPYMSEGGGSF